MSFNSLENNSGIEPKNIQKSIDFDQRNKEIEKIERNQEILKEKENSIINQNLKLDSKEKSIETLSSSISTSSEKSDDNSSSKLKYGCIAFYILIIINIFLPGIGTIIAAIGWGDSRTKELICRGIIQFFTAVFLIGWIQAIQDAINYFKYSQN